MVTTEAIRREKLQSKCHHQQTNTKFFTGRMPFLSPINSVNSTEGKKTSLQSEYHIKISVNNIFESLD